MMYVILRIMWEEGRGHVPVVLVGEVEKTAGNAALLENVEEGQALRDRETVVLVAVDDKLGSAELEDALGGGRIPATVVVTSIPEGAVELWKKK